MTFEPGVGIRGLHPYGFEGSLEDLPKCTVPAHAADGHRLVRIVWAPPPATWSEAEYSCGCLTRNAAVQGG